MGPNRWRVTLASAVLLAGGVYLPAAEPYEQRDDLSWPADRVGGEGCRAADDGGRGVGAEPGRTR